MKYQFPLIAINRDDSTRLFYTAAEFRAFAFDRRNGGVDAEWVTYASDSLWARLRGDCTTNEWIVRDDRGRPVDKNVFWIKYPNWKNRKGKHVYRDGPVPSLRYWGRQKHDAPRKRHGGRGVALRNDVHKREFEADY